MIVQGALGLLLFGFCVLLARRLSGSFGTALVLALVAQLVANFRFVMRPELFALFLLVALLAILTRCRDERRPAVLLWILPIAALWANCHGSFVLAPLVAGLFAAGEGLQAALATRGEAAPARARAAWRAGAPYAAAAVGALLASLLNPLGAGLLQFAADVQGSSAIRALIKEWLPTLHPLFMITPAFRIFVVAVVAVVAVLVALRRHVTATDLLLVALFGGLAFQRNRHVVWFGFAMLVVVAGLVGRARPDARMEQRLRVGALALALVGVCACLAWGNTRGARPYESPSNNFTPAMIARLADPALHGNVFNSYELGAELIYRDWPRLKPSIDSRVDSYGDTYFLLQQRALRDEPLLLAFLDAWHVNHMLLLRRDFENAVRDMPALAAAWHVRFADEKMLLLERNVPLPDAT
jgi:MFS family permease